MPKTTFPDPSNVSMARSFSATLKRGRGKPVLCLLEVISEAKTKTVELKNHTTGESLYFDFDRLQEALQVEAQIRS